MARPGPEAASRAHIHPAPPPSARAFALPLQLRTLGPSPLDLWPVAPAPLTTPRRRLPVIQTAPPPRRSQSEPGSLRPAPSPFPLVGVIWERGWVGRWVMRKPIRLKEGEGGSQSGMSGGGYKGNTAHRAGTGQS